MTSWAQYVLSTMGEDDQKTAALKAKVDQSAISRWVRANVPGKADNVAAFARAYGRPVLEAFVAAGFLTAEEARARPATTPDYSSLTNDELLDLVRARMEPAAGALSGRDGLSAIDLGTIRREQQQDATRRQTARKAAKKGASVGRDARAEQDRQAEEGGA